MKKNLKVEDLMDRVFVTFDPNTPVREAVDILGKKRLFGACVANKEGQVLGILSEKKCIELYNRAIAEDSSDIVDNAKVSEIMYDEFKSIPKTTGITEAAEIFLSTEFRRMPVVDSGKLIGQITRRDIIRAVELFNM